MTTRGWRPAFGRGAWRDNFGTGPDEVGVNAGGGFRGLAFGLTPAFELAAGPAA